MSKQELEQQLVNKEQVFIDSGLLHFQEKPELPINVEVPLEQFILDVILIYNVQLSTLDSIESSYIIQDRHRSIEDIFRITKYYFTEVTLLEVVVILFNLNITKKVRILGCGNINKITFYPHKRYDDCLEIYKKQYNQYYITKERDIKRESRIGSMFLDESLDLRIEDFLEYFELVPKVKEELVEN